MDSPEDQEEMTPPGRVTWVTPGRNSTTPYDLVTQHTCCEWTSKSKELVKCRPSKTGASELGKRNLKKMFKLIKINSLKKRVYKLKKHRCNKVTNNSKRKRKIVPLPLEPDGMLEKTHLVETQF